MKKKVFSTEAYVKNLASLGCFGVLKDLILKPYETWCVDCEGKTIEECKEKKYLILDEWCIEVDD